MFGISPLTKSCFVKNQSYEVLTPDRRYDLLRTSDSLNEGLPIKMTREKCQK